MISVVFPLFNEKNNFFLIESLRRFHKANAEIIVVDSSHNNYVKELSKDYNSKYFYLNTNSRAVRINFGLQKCRGDKVIIHHPRSLLANGVIDYLETCQHSWGAFTHKFNQPHWLLNLTSWYSNYIRGDIKNIFYLDHCFYLERSLFDELGPFPEVDIFEDTWISMILGQKYKGYRAPHTATTSAIRFMKNGIYRQAYINQTLKIKFRKNVSYAEMNKFYERDLELNSIY